MWTVVRVVVRLLVAAVLVPAPIGVGPRYHPAAGAHGACARAPVHAGQRVHLELFALRRVVIVPAGVGLRGARLRFGRVTAARCRCRLWTTDPTGVVRFDGRRRLGDVFGVWGERFGPARLLSFRGGVRLYRNGIQVMGDPRRLVLRDRDQLVLEVGGYVPPHRSYRFPRWSSHA
jgi:hypothetical protein